jgi:hypothetical protein
MRPPKWPASWPNKFLIFYMKLVFFPVVLVSLSVKYVMLGIALLTPVDWNEEEEALLRKAIWHGYRPHQLIFAFWRRSKDIEAKAKELGLL